LCGSLALAALVVLAGVGSPAAAGPPTLVVSGLTVEPGQVRFTLTAHDAGALDPGAVAVRSGSTTLASTVSLTGTTVNRAAMAVLDATTRVPPAQFDTARAAVGALADALPPDVRLGLVLVGLKATAVIPPTTDRASVRQALNGAERAGGSGLPAGVTIAADALRAAGLSATADRRVYVFADGKDATADLTDAARANLAGDPIPVDVLAYPAGSTGAARLLAYATASGGRLLSATDPASASSAAAAAAADFSAALAVTAAVPGGLAGSTSTLDISVGESLRVVQPVTFASLSTVDSIPPALHWIPSWLAYLFAVLVFGALAAIVLIFAWPRELPIRRIRQVTLFGPGRSRRSTRLDAGSVPTAIARTALAATASVVRSRGMESQIALRLERAGMAMQPHEWVLLRALVTLGGGIALFVALGPAGAVLGLVLGFVATMLYQTARVDRRCSRFADQLPDALQLVIGSLKSGFALPQALDALVSESPEPIRAEFGRALAEHRLGADLSDALERVAQRTGSDDLVWAVMGVRIQREVGGNLAEVLQTTVDTMRERSRLRRHVRALSAEGRLSAWVLIALPLGLGLFMFVFRRSYMTPLVTDPTGITMLVGGGLLFVLGIVWLLRVIKVEA
jgi:tight adherence protein B